MPFDAVTLFPGSAAALGFHDALEEEVAKCYLLIQR